MKAIEEEIKAQKYINVRIPSLDKNDNPLSWRVPEQTPKVIEQLEILYPDYMFHQFVTSAGNGGYGDFAIMKRKTKVIKTTRDDYYEKIRLTK